MKHWTKMGKNIVKVLTQSIKKFPITQPHSLPINYQKVYGIFQSGAVVITTARLHSTKLELRFCAGSNSAGGMSKIRNSEDL